jgi:hypothetical protein
VRWKDWTLSDNALKAVVAASSSRSPKRASLLEVRDVPGPGVEYVIQFPKAGDGSSSNEFLLPPDAQFVPLGVRQGGDPRLALKFTLLSVTSDDPTDTGGVLVVGAYVSDRYRPETIDLDPETTNVSETTTSSTTLKPLLDQNTPRRLGWHLHTLRPKGWNPAGFVVTLRVEPVRGANIIPVQFHRDQIPTLIEQLGAPALKVRERAQKQLISIGESAREALSDAAEHGRSLEIRLRAREILAALEKRRKGN